MYDFLRYILDTLYNTFRLYNCLINEIQLIQFSKTKIARDSLF